MKTAIFALLGGLLDAASICVGQEPPFFRGPTQIPWFEQKYGNYAVKIVVPVAYPTDKGFVLPSGRSKAEYDELNEFDRNSSSLAPDTRKKLNEDRAAIYLYLDGKEKHAEAEQKAKLDRALVKALEGEKGQAGAPPPAQPNGQPNVLPVNVEALLSKENLASLGWSKLTAEEKAQWGNFLGWFKGEILKVPVAPARFGR